MYWLEWHCHRKLLQGHLTMKKTLHCRVKYEQLQFCNNSHCSTYFLVMRNMSLWYGLVFANSDTYSFIFSEMTSNICRLNAFLHVSAPAHRACKTVKLLRRKKPDIFRWIVDPQTVHIFTQLTIRYGRPFRKAFTVHTSRGLMNWNSGWFRSGARTLSTRLLTIGVKHLQQAFARMAHISSKSCELIQMAVYDLFIYFASKWAKH